MKGLSVIEARAIVVLKRCAPMRAAALGEELWGGENRPSRCTAPYARSAGRLLKRLVDRDLVQAARTGDGRRWWRLTADGEKMARALATEAMKAYLGVSS